MNKPLLSTIKWLQSKSSSNMQPGDTVCICSYCKLYVHQLPEMTDDEIALAVEKDLLRRQIKQLQKTDPMAGILGLLGFDVYFSTEAVARMNRALGLYLGLMFLVYCATYVWACPKADLACAVSAEVFIFAVSLMLLRAKVFDFAKVTSVSPKWVSSALDKWKSSFKVLQSFKLLVLGIIATLVTIDYCALASAAFCDTPLTISLYTIAGSQLIGLHPAATLEVLAGAYVENKEFTRAEKLYMDILAIRTRIYGPISGPVGAIDADLGDLSVRQGDFPKAESWYRKSVELSEAPGGPPGTGRALTGLATVLRQSGRLGESEQCYQRALNIRAKVYGTGSRQYHDTKRAYEQLLGTIEHASTSQ